MGVVDKNNVLKDNINSITQHSINVIDKEFDDFKNVADFFEFAAKLMRR